MKVAVFADTYTPQINGVTNTLNMLVQFYEKAGIEYKVFAPRYDTNPQISSEQEDSRIERFLSIKFIPYPENRVTFPSTFRISSILSDFQPDIIHNMTEFNMGFAGLGYGKRHGIPTISNYTTNFSQYAQYYKVDFLEQTIWKYLHWFHTQNSLTLCPSLASQQLLRSKGIHNTRIFSRGIDANGFHPRHRNEELRKDLGVADKLTFLYVGRVSCEKDLDILSSSFRELCQSHEEQIAMVITGDGPYMDRCKHLFPENTVFTGYRKGKDLAEIYASCDIFVCPSSTETFGNVILEAMASGLPVIGADAGGVGEIIQHNVTGLKFHARNISSLTNCMTRLVEDIDLRDYLIMNEREYVAERSWDKIFADLLDTYQELLTEKGKGIISA